MHHYYGTKENLLDAATTPPQAFLEQIITAWQTPPAELGEKLRTIVERSMMGLSAQALSEDERLLRSSLIASQLMGFAFMRFIWKIEPLATLADDDVVSAIAPTIQRYLDGDVGTALVSTVRPL